MYESSATIAGDARECGARLRDARTAAGLGRHEVAARLRMPLHVVEALEEGRWEVIGAGVFVRGQLRSYARLVGVDIEPFLVAGAAPAEPVRLVSHEHTPRYQRWMESAGRRAVYVVITAAIAVPVWLATRSHLNEVGRPPPRSMRCRRRPIPRRRRRHPGPLLPAASPGTPTAIRARPTWPRWHRR